MTNAIDTFINIENAAHEGAFGANPRATPTDAQAKAGNYKVGRATIYGLPVAIEQPRHSYRTGQDPSGKRWENKMAAHYGYFSGTKGADGDGVDCFIGFFPQSEQVYIINQHVNGKFDEHKVMLCFPDEETAKRAYLDSYDKGWTGLHSIITASITQFKWWLKNGNMNNQIALNHLPYEGFETMKQRVAWDNTANPIGTALHNVLYEIRRADSGENLIFDSVCMADILDDADEVMALDAMVTPYAKLERKMQVLKSVMERHSDAIKVEVVQISDPFKQSGVAQVAVIFELSDGQTVSIFFHNPDVDPKKIQQSDELVSWKWLLNRKDITVVVAPERGIDLNIKEVAARIMRLADKNSAAFKRANVNRAEKMQAIEDIKTEITGLEQELKDVQHELEVAKVEAEDRAANPLAIADELNPTSPEGYAKIKGIGNMELRYQDALDDFFQERIVAVRNALMDVGWSGVRQKGNYDLSKNGYVAKFNFKRVGAGANMVGYYVSVMDGNDIQAEIGDRLTGTPADVAASIDAVVTNSGQVTQANYPDQESDTNPEPIVPTEDPIANEESFKQAILQALVDKFGWANQSTTGGPLFWVTKEIGGGFTGGMVNPTGIRRVSAKIDGAVMKAMHGDNALVTVMFAVSATPEQNAKSLDDAVNAIDPNYVNPQSDESSEQKNQQAEVTPPAEESGAENTPIDQSTTEDQDTQEQALINAYVESWQIEADKINAAVAAIDWLAIADYESGRAEENKLRTAVSTVNDIDAARLALKDAGIEPYDNRLNGIIEESPQFKAHGEAVSAYRAASDKIAELAKAEFIKSGKEKLANLPEDATLEEKAAAVFVAKGIEGYAGERIINAIREKDIEALRSMLGNTDNKASRTVFEIATGIKLEKTVKGTLPQIDEWAGITPEQRAAIEAEKQAVRDADNLLSDLKHAWNPLEYVNVTTSAGNATMQDWLVALYGSGYTHIETRKKGAATTYWMVNKEHNAQGFNKSKVFNAFLKAALAFGEGDNLLAMKKALKALGVDVAEKELTPVERVDAAYSFNADNDFKEWLAESVDKTEQSPFLTAKAMDEAAKRNGADIEWGFFGGMSKEDDAHLFGKTLDSVEGDSEADIALIDEDELGATFTPDSGDEAIFDSAIIDSPCSWFGFKLANESIVKRQAYEVLPSNEQISGDVYMAIANGEEGDEMLVSGIIVGVKFTASKVLYTVAVPVSPQPKDGVNIYAIIPDVDSIAVRPINYLELEPNALDSVSSKSLFKIKKSAIFDSAALDGVEQDGYVGKITKGGAVVGRIDIDGDGKALVFVGDKGDTRVRYKSQVDGELRDYMYSDDDAAEMVDSLFNVAQAEVSNSEPEESEPATLEEATTAIKYLRGFIGQSQLNAIATAMRGEEKRFFFDKVVALEKHIKAMPKTYDQDGMGDKAIAYLHYFKGGMDWHITERDMDDEQLQAFGLSNLGYGDELGYISIVELIKNNVELDLYWTPKTIGAIRGNDESETENEPVPVPGDSDETITPSVEEPSIVDNPIEEPAQEQGNPEAESMVEQSVTGNTELDKQRAKLRSLADLQERMKAANKIVKSKTLTDEQKKDKLAATGEDYYRLMKPDFAGRIGYADYLLTNNNAVIKNTQKRIEQLEAKELAESLAASGERETSYDFDGGTIDLDYGDDRLRVNFDSKPAADMISKLKQNGFKWSYTNTAWQRQLTDNAISTANYLFGTQIKTAASAMKDEVNKPRGDVIVPATETQPQGNPMKQAFIAELDALKAETNIEAFDRRLDEIAGRIEGAGLMEELDAELNAAADVLTELLAQAEKSNDLGLRDS